jgi:nitronate monooxygenase
MEMSIGTPLTALLGIKHPIRLAPMDVVSGARLTAAVSSAGGFGNFDIAAVIAGEAVG